MGSAATVEHLERRSIRRLYGQVTSLDLAIADATSPKERAQLLARRTVFRALITLRVSVLVRERPDLSAPGANAPTLSDEIAALDAALVIPQLPDDLASALLKVLEMIEAERSGGAVAARSATRRRWLERGAPADPIVC